MELITLDSTFQPNKVIDSYESLIWAERYSKNGDFELTSPDIESTMSKLPLESYVSLRESTVPMIVEDYKIRKAIGEVPKLVVTGRAFETCLERRGSVASLPGASKRVLWNVPADKPSDAAYKAIRIVIGDSLARSNLPALSPAVDPLDAIPEINLPLPTDYTTGLATQYEITARDLYATVVELIDANHHGIKSVRPLPGKSTVDVQVYNGADLTSTIVFDARFDQFIDATYLLSARGSTNIAYVYGTNGALKVLKSTVDGTHPEPSGLKRRVVVVDEQSDSTLTNAEALRSRGLIELFKNNATALFDGETSVQVAAGYNAVNGYSLGDIIKLNGEYGLYATVRVAEFIRTSEAAGEKAYPTFEVVD